MPINSPESTSGGEERELWSQTARVPLPLGAQCASFLTSLWFSFLFWKEGALRILDHLITEEINKIIHVKCLHKPAYNNGSRDINVATANDDSVDHILLD